MARPLTMRSRSILTATSWPTAKRLCSTARSTNPTSSPLRTSRSASTASSGSTRRTNSQFPIKKSCPFGQLFFCIKKTPPLRRSGGRSLETPPVSSADSPLLIEGPLCGCLRPLLLPRHSEKYTIFLLFVSENGFRPARLFVNTYMYIMQLRILCMLHKI